MPSLLPRLRYLDMTFENEDSVTDVSMFKLIVRPSVRKLRLYLILPHCYHTILPLLVPSLDAGVNEAWQSLTHLNLYNSLLAGPNSNSHVIPYIGRLPVLQSLGINLSGETFSWASSHHDLDTLFKPLRSLTIHNFISSLTEATKFLGIFKPRLSSLEVSCYLGVSSSGFLNFVTQLAHPNIRGQLESFKFRPGFSNPSDFSPLPTEFFFTLAMLPRLQTVDLHLYNQVCLTDEILSKLAPSWPYLIHFDVVGSRPPPPPENEEELSEPTHALPTFLGIARFCTQCPRLTRLGLEIDRCIPSISTFQKSLGGLASAAASTDTNEENIYLTKSKDGPSAPIPGSVGASSLLLHIYKTAAPAINELQELASYLDRFLPRLEKISATEEQWNKLQELILARTGRARC
jgi:hypothetical protein